MMMTAEQFFVKFRTAVRTRRAPWTLVAGYLRASSGQCPLAFVEGSPVMSMMSGVHVAHLKLPFKIATMIMYAADGQAALDPIARRYRRRLLAITRTWRV